MKFADDAWVLYRDKFGMQDSDRARIEQAMTDEQAGFLPQAKGDEHLATGLMMLALVRDMAADFGIPEDFILKQLIAKSPKPAHLKRAIRAARKGH